MRLLISALISAFLGALVFSGASYAQQSTALIGVTRDMTLIITLSGKMVGSSFADVEPYVANSSDDAGTMVHSADRITVIDYTGMGSTYAGHHFRIKFNSSVWSYQGNGGGADLAVKGFSAVPSDDEVLFRIDASNYSKTFNKKSESSCEGTAATMELYTIPAVNGGQPSINYSLLGENSEWCPGSSVYTPGSLEIVGPANGFVEGTYTINGTIQLVDGVS